MTKEEIDAVLERVRTWPQERQQEAIDMLLTLEEMNSGDLYELSPEELADVEAGLAQAERGEFASEEEIQAIFRRYK